MGYSIKCRKCSKETYRNSFIQDGKDCQKKQCWLQCKKAREAMAEEIGCDTVELLPAVEGKIKLHEEPVKHNALHQAESGRYEKGVWVPYHEHYFD